MIRLIVVDSPFPSDKPNILYEEEIEEWIETSEAIDRLKTNSFKANKNNWVFVEDDDGAVGERLEVEE